MRVLVCGGRDYKDQKRLFSILDNYLNPLNHPLPLRGLRIVAGGAKGADSLAIDWAVTNWVSFEEYPADWKQYGKRAGILRNIQMLEEGKPDLVIAFPGGRGTAHMVKIAREAGVPVYEPANS